MRQDQGLIVRHPVLRLTVPACPIDFAVHCRFIALQKRQIIAIDQEVRDFQLTLRGPLQRSRGFCEPAKAKIVESKSFMGKREVRIQSNRLLGRLNSPFILASAPRAPSAQDPPSLPITGIGLHPCLDRPQFLLQISRNLPVIEKQDKEPFRVADAVPQLKGFEGGLDGQIGLSHVPVKKP